MIITVIYSLSCLVLIGYVVLFLYSDYWFNKKNIENHTSATTLNYCAIVICAHNEKNNIEKCLLEIIEQNGVSEYCEIIFVNDGSTDNTETLAKQVLSKTNIPYLIITHAYKEGKKKSIAEAVDVSSEKVQWIILRDADTYTCSKKWFLSLNKIMNEETGILLAPLITQCSDNTSFISKIQYYEGLALMNVTKGFAEIQKPFLGNAANLAFNKKLFKLINAYAGNKHILSGDDVFLIDKMYKAKIPIKSVFNHDTIVYTNAPNNIIDLVKQKIRWASKFKSLNRPINTVFAVIIACVNILPIILLAFNLFYLIVFLLIKILIDIKVCHSVKKQLHLTYSSILIFLLAEVIYIPYVCAITTLSIIKSFRIKN